MVDTLQMEKKKEKEGKNQQTCNCLTHKHPEMLWIQPLKNSDDHFKSSTTFFSTFT